MSSFHIVQFTLIAFWCLSLALYECGYLNYGDLGVVGATDSLREEQIIHNIARVSRRPRLTECRRRQSSRNVLGCLTAVFIIDILIDHN